MNTAWWFRSLLDFFFFRGSLVLRSLIQHSQKLNDTKGKFSMNIRAPFLRIFTHLSWVSGYDRGKKDAAFFPTSVNIEKC